MYMTRQARNGIYIPSHEKRSDTFYFQAEKELLIQVSGINNLNFLFEVWPPSK
jgi:hypothetical protein